MTLDTHFELGADELLSAGKQPLRVRARSLLCYLAVRELGMTTTAVARKVGLTQPAVSRAVERGRGLARELEIDWMGKLQAPGSRVRTGGFVYPPDWDRRIRPGSRRWRGR